MSEISLADFITLQRGFDLPSDKRYIGTVPVVASTGISGYHNESKVNGPGVVIGRSGSIGGGQFIEEDFWPLNTTLWVKDFKGHPERFVYYLLKSIDFSRFNSGAAVPSLNRNLIAHIKVKNLGIETEKKIAHLLGTIDDSINNYVDENRTLESLEQTIFKSWFVNFDPVYAKKLALEAGLTADQVERAAMAIISGVCNPIEFAENFKEMDDLLSQKLAKMSKDEQEKLRSLAALFPSEFEESELGEIPKGWEVCTIESVADVIGGGTPSTPHKEYYCEAGSGIPWLSPKDLSGYDWKFIKNGATDITELGLKKSSARLMPEGTVVISSRAPIGYVAIAEQKLCTNQGFKSLVPKNIVATNFLYNWAKLNIPAMEAVATGSTFKEISGSNMKNLKLVIPPKELALSFEEFVHASAELQKNLRHETNTLEKLRDTLLPRLLAGEINLDKIQLDSKEI